VQDIKEVLEVILPRNEITEEEILANYFAETESKIIGKKITSS